MSLWRCRHCGGENDLAEVLERLDRMARSIEIEGNRIVSALDNLKAADDALKAEVTTFLQDIAGRLSGITDEDVQAVADDINAEVAALQGGDPVTAPAPTEPAPGDGSTPTA